MAKRLQRARMKDEPDHNIRCPKCGNTDTDKMEYVENVEAAHRILGVDSNGIMVVENQEDYRCANDDNGRIRCNATVILPDGVAGPSKCLHDFKLPEDLTFVNQLEDKV